MEKIATKMITLTPNQTLPDEMLNPAVFDFTNPPIHPIILSNTMQEFTYENDGLSVAANQIGVNLRVVYLRGMESACFNPKITEWGDESQVLEEMSLSVPRLIVKIKRVVTLRCRYTDAFGNTHVQVFSGMTARALQQAIDSLDGIRLIDRASLFHREKALKEYNDITA
jgi:peptide deformylase